MTSIYTTLLYAGLFSVFGLCSTITKAACTQTTVAQTEDSRTAKIIFGNVNLPSKHLLPAGSVIDSKIIPPTAYTYNGANAESLLWTCDKSDLNQIYFLVATNGDDRVGGYWDIGGKDGLEDVYATYFAYVGLRQSMNGVNLTRYWQKIPVQQYDEDENKIFIRLKHLPHLEATLYRISQLAPTSGATTAYCGKGQLPTTGSYSCNQPNAYIQLSGESNVYMPFSRDQAGEDSAQFYRFWGSDNGFGYGLNTLSNTLSTQPACVVRNNTPLVMLPIISAQALNQGQSDQVPFQVEIECENLVSSGTATGQTAIAFQPDSNAYQRAVDMGLSNAQGSVSHLLSDDYGQDTQLAQGVGIQISNTANQHTMWLQNPTAITGGGAANGWYPVLEGQPQHLGETVSEHGMYMQNYQAELKALPDQQATPGRVKATATIVVKVQ
jgi:type 1 fimbria pilin